MTQFIVEKTITLVFKNNMNSIYWSKQIHLFQELTHEQNPPFCSQLITALIIISMFLKTISFWIWFYYTQFLANYCYKFLISLYEFTFTFLTKTKFSVAACKKTKKRANWFPKIDIEIFLISCSLCYHVSCLY